MPPDTDCAHAIIHSGITVVNYDEFYNKEQDDTDRQEKDDIKDAKKLLRQAHVLLM